jgi:predicted helicase
MSQLLINQFRNDLDRLRVVSGQSREGIVSEAFKDLLKGWAKQHDLVFIPQYGFETPAKEKRYVDGALLYSLRVPLGYWEAKDEEDDLDKEIDRKKRRGYPQDNIIFEDSRTAVLIQNRQEVIRAPVEDTQKLARLLELFFAYERPEIAQFRKAVEQFKTDLPAVLDALREKIEAASASNAGFKKAEKKFLDHAKDTINPAVTAADVREMLIQHILTEEIFAKVFDDGEFHRQNNIAKELYALEEKFFTGVAKRQTLKQLEPYYAAIRAAAAQISSHSEKQTFLKVIYENFYKVYNPKAADRLGVIYTPNEIVRFMIESADWLCDKHFGKSLVDAGVEILDPATGTGTFICELLEHFRGSRQKLAHKYKEELHANEVAILPYYVANLNIEATYAAITGQYAEFPNLCFVDTLDNVAGLGKFSGHQEDLFGAMSEENVERIKRQNKRKISVIIGNPPYNANQQNENDNNKNREYRRVDTRIKDTYIKDSTAQKTKLYDMYARFFRWASDRIKDEGIIAFVTNRSFIESRTFDGFRKIVARDFNEIWIVDLGGDVRANPKISGTKNNVFGIQTGVAISFLVKRKEAAKAARIFYARRPEMETAEDKLSFVSNARLPALEMDTLKPDEKQNWLHLTNNDFDKFIPIALKETKGDYASQSIFQLYSLGIVTNRDEWLYDESPEALLKKAGFFVERFNKERSRWIKAKRPRPLSDFVSRDIKWTSELEAHLVKGTKVELKRDAVIRSFYRPFVERWTYFAPVLTHRPYQNFSFFPNCLASNVVLAVAVEERVTFSLLATTLLPNKDAFMPSAAQCFARYRYTSDGVRLDNITDWALDQFQSHYKKLARPITKDAIFHYVYAVLHDPSYREKYAQNLKREFPRIPFYKDFWRWADWGEALMALHIGYETVEPWPLKRTDTKDEKAARASLAPKPILKADKDNGIIVLDSETQLSGVPATAWDYKLGNRSGLEWVLDQYKEKTPKDPTIREKFNTYRFKDHKEKVVDLLKRVARVSVETQEIVAAMKALPRK